MARARGKRGGRKPVMDEKKVALASAMLKDGSNSVTDVCEALGVSRATLYRYLRPDGTPTGRAVELTPRKGTAGPPSRA